MKLTPLISVFTLLLIQTRATAQESKQDPLLGNYRLGNSAEIVLLWAERSISSSESDQRIYDFLNLNNPDPSVPDQLLPQALARWKMSHLPLPLGPTMTVGCHGCGKN